MGVNMDHKSSRRVGPQGVRAKIIAFFCLFCGSFAMAELRLGEIDMLSTAGQPLRAQIPVGQTDISIEEGIEVSFASDAMFAQAGLTRDAYLAEVGLSIVTNSLGDLVVEVAADKPIDRPYIDFLVQLDLPEGRVIREYRLLRNPYEAEDQPHKQVFESSSIGKPEVAQPRIYQHRVVAGDTLWNIAKRLRPSHMTIVATMDRLYATNPDAFLDGDSTRLRKGYVINFTSVAEDKADPVVAISETSSIPSIPKVTLIPIIDNQTTVSDENDGVTEDAEVQTQAQPEIPQEEISDREMQSVPEQQPVLEEQSVPQQQPVSEDQLVSEEQSVPEEQLPPATMVESPSLPVVDSLQTDSVDSHTLVEEPEVQTVVEAEWVEPDQQRPVFNIDAQQLKDWLVRAQQLPVDLWVFVLALVVVILALWRSNSRRIKSEAENFSSEAQEQPSKVDQADADELTKSVLDGPFASSHGDDVFNHENHADDKAQAQQIATEETDLPGEQALQDQLNQEAEKPLPEDDEAVEFDDDDIIDLDPVKIRLDMAMLCIEMGDIENAQSVLEEVISEADSDGKAKARAILDSIEI